MTVEATTPIPWDVVRALFPSAEEFGAWLNQTAATEVITVDGKPRTIHRGAGGRFGRGSRLGDTMHALADVDDDDEADGVEFGGGEKSFNWSTRNDDGSYQLDIEDNQTREPDEDADPDDEEEDYRGFARMRMTPADMKRFAAGLSATLLMHQLQANPLGDDDPNRSLLAALLANTPTKLEFTDGWENQRLDWGYTDPDGALRLDARDDDGDEVSFRLTLPELRRLHAQLVRQNLEEDDNPYIGRGQTAATEMIERDGHMIAVNRGSKGRFSKMSAIAEALDKSGNAADSLAGFDRPALMREAKRRNLDVPRGAQPDAVRQLILDSTRTPDAPAATPADTQRAALGKLNVPALKTRAAADGHSFPSKAKKADLIDMIMSGPRNPDPPAERVVADRGAGQKGRLNGAELDAANAEIDAMVADPQPWARERMNNIVSRMTLPQLQQVAARHNIEVDKAASTKALKASRLTENLVGHKLDSAAIERSIMGGGDRDRARVTAERAARERQAGIDAARPRAEFLGDLEEALANDTDIATLRRMTNQALRIRGVAGDPHAERIAGVVATSIDTGEIRRALNAVTSAQGLQRLDAGDGFDPAQHQAVGKLAPGDPVELVRPGYSTDINGENVTLSKPTVAAAPDDRDAQPANTADRVAELDRRIGELHVKIRNSSSPSERARLQAKKDSLTQERSEIAGPTRVQPSTGTRVGINSREARDARAREAQQDAEPGRDRSVRRRAAALRAERDSPLRALSGSALTAALETADAGDAEAVRAGLDGRDLGELVQIARDMPTVTMPERQNRTALVDAIVRGATGAEPNRPPQADPMRLSRADFDAMDPAAREQVLSQLRAARDSGEQKSRTVSSNRTSMGTTIRGMVDADSVVAARQKLRELTYVAPAVKDNSPSGRAARLADEGTGALSGATLAELQEVSRAAGIGGFSPSWKRDKAVKYIADSAIAGDRMPKRYGPEGLAESLRGLDRRRATAVLEAVEARDGVTVAQMQQTAEIMGLPVPKGTKSEVMKTLASRAGDAPKAPPERGGLSDRDLALIAKVEAENAGEPTRAQAAARAQRVIAGLDAVLAGKPPTADEMSQAVGQGLTDMVRQAAAKEDIKRALARYKAEGDTNAAARAERLLAQQERGLFTPDDVLEHLADLDASRSSTPEMVALNRPRPVTSPMNAHSLKVGDVFVGGNGERVTVVGHERGMEDGLPVQYVDVVDGQGNTSRLTLGLNQPVDRLVGVTGGGGGTFGLETHEVFCMSPVVHPGPCEGWKDALPDGDPRKTKGRAKAKPAPRPRRAAAAGEKATAPRLAAADIAKLADDDLFDLFAELSKQDTLDEPLMRRLIDDMDRRERQAPVAALEDADLTPEQRRVDELVAGGRDYLSAYTEVHGGNETPTATVDRRPGERADAAVRRSYDEFTHLAYLQAEKATRGHMLNRAGQKAGINPLTLFSGPVSRARRYASEDLMRWWAGNGRMNLAQFRAQVTGGQKDKAAAAKTRQQSNSRDFI